MFSAAYACTHVRIYACMYVHVDMYSFMQSRTNIAAGILRRKPCAGTHRLHIAFLLSPFKNMGALFANTSIVRVRHAFPLETLTAPSDRKVNEVVDKSWTCKACGALEGALMCMTCCQHIVPEAMIHWSIAERGESRL